MLNPTREQVHFRECERTGEDTADEPFPEGPEGVACVHVLRSDEGAFALSDPDKRYVMKSAAGAR